MSDETHAALETAIRAHVRDEAEGAYLTDWVVYAAAEDLNDPEMSHYVNAVPQGITTHRLVGLAQQLVWKCRRELADEGDDE